LGGGVFSATSRMTGAAKLLRYRTGGDDPDAVIEAAKWTNAIGKYTQTLQKHIFCVRYFLLEV
jgi:hypothetical protein